MIKIVQIKEKTLLVNENGSEYEISSDLLDFIPRVGDFITYTREPEGKITRVSLVNNLNSNTLSKNPQGKALATVSVVFGSLGFYPLIIIGSLVGLITGLIGIAQKNDYSTRSIIGVSLSAGSLLLWIMIFVLVNSAANNW